MRLLDGIAIGPSRFATADDEIIVNRLGGPAERVPDLINDGTDLEIALIVTSHQGGMKHFTCSPRLIQLMFESDQRSVQRRKARFPFRMMPHPAVG